MKITKIDVYLLENKLTSSMIISRGGFTVRNHVLVKIHTDEGITGLGEGIGNAKLIRAILKEQLCELAIGQNPFDIELLREKLMDSQVYFERKGSAICAASAIEMACWDIKGKALGVPVYQLLGGKYKTELETYASDVYWEDDISKMANNAARVAGLGFKNLKIHVGHKPPKEDYFRVKAVRDAIGSKMELMVDLNCGYDSTSALYAVRQWEEFNLKWIEEPLNPNHISAMAYLREKSPIPIASGENEFQIYGFKDLFEANAIDYAMPDVGRVGGLQETKNICSLALAFGIPVSPHNYSSGVLMAATMQILASTSNANLLEVDTSKNSIINELLETPLVIKNGTVEISNRPGLGVDLSDEVIRKYIAN